MSPRVSVVTPFYNAAPFLDECIRSVLGQTLRDFEYLLVDNCSSDGSLEIARRYAAADSRIRLWTNERFLDQVANYNAALGRISTESEYCKIVQADDWIYKRCLEEMVELAEGHPAVAIVSSYRLRGHQVNGVGLPLEPRIVAGREICRRQLTTDAFFFGSPTTLLFRSNVVRSRNPFYEAGRLHEDTEACYEILQHHDLGFVHQVLSFTRIDNPSIMSAARDFDPHVLDKLIVLKRFGPVFLERREFADAWRRHERRYLRRLAEAALSLRSSDYWRYQRRGWASIGYAPSALRVAAQGCLVLLDLALNPQNSLARLVHLLRSRLARSTR